MPGNPAYKQTVHRPFLKACRVSSVFHVVPLQEKTKNHYIHKFIRMCMPQMCTHTHTYKYEYTKSTRFCYKITIVTFSFLLLLVSFYTHIFLCEMNTYTGKRSKDARIHYKYTYKNLFTAIPKSTRKTILWN